MGILEIMKRLFFTKQILTQNLLKHERATVPNVGQLYLWKNKRVPADWVHAALV